MRVKKGVATSSEERDVVRLATVSAQAGTPPSGKEQGAAEEDGGAAQLGPRADL